jgi:hypothetical protein
MMIKSGSPSSIPTVTAPMKATTPVLKSRRSPGAAAAAWPLAARALKFLPDPAAELT